MKKLFTLLTLALLSIGTAWATDYTWTFEDYCTANSITGKSNKNIKDKNAGLADVEVSSSNGIALTYSCGANNSVSIMYHLSSAATVGGTNYSSYVYMGGGSSGNTDRVFKTGSAISGTGKLTIVYAGTADGTCTIYDADDTSKALATMEPATNSAIQSTALILGSGKKLLIVHSSKCAIYAIKWTEVTTHNVSAVTSTGTDTYGTVSATSTTVEEGGTTTITAVPASGYKVTNWAVSGTGASITPSGASNSLTTTLTMGTADATVTVTFGAAGTVDVTHTLSNVTKTSGETTVAEGAEYTAIFAANSGYVLPEAIAVTIGGAAATAGTQYTWNKATGTVTIGAAYVTGDIVITVTGVVAYTLVYDANGGTGTMEDIEGSGNITLSANTYTKSGYTFMGWATSQANADAGTVAYADGAAYILSANATLYAVWAANDYSFAPTSSSGTMAANDVVATSIGGKMVYTPADGGSPTLKYSTTSGSNCIEFGGASQCQVTVTLDKVMKVGTVITLNYYTSSASARGFIIANSGGTTKATFSQSAIGTYTGQYTVVAGDGLEGRNVFIIKRNNNAYLNSVTVVKCDDKYAVSTLSGRNYATYVTSQKLDFASAEGITAYIATGLNGAKDAVVLSPVDIVPAGTPIIVKTDTKGATVNVPVTTADADDVSSNALVAGDGVKAYNNGGNSYYYLASDLFHLANAGTLQSGKAYLEVAGGTPAPQLTISFGGETTGVNEVSEVKEVNDNSWYNLAGQRVAQPTKGLYIVNGRKVVIK